MHPLIYSCKLVDIPRNLARFGLKPGDQLDLCKVADRVEVIAKPKGLIAWMFCGGARPVGQIDEAHCRCLRPFLEEARRFRIKVVGIDGFVKKPKGVSVSIWVDS